MKGTVFVVFVFSTLLFVPVRADIKLDDFVNCLMNCECPASLHEVSKNTQTCIHTVAVEDQSRVLKGMDIMFSKPGASQKKALDGIKKAHWYVKVPGGKYCVTKRLVKELKKHT